MLVHVTLSKCSELMGGRRGSETSGDQRRTEAKQVLVHNSTLPSLPLPSFTTSKASLFAFICRQNGVRHCPPHGSVRVFYSIPHRGLAQSRVTLDGRQFSRAISAGQLMEVQDILDFIILFVRFTNVSIRVCKGTFSGRTVFLTTSACSSSTTASANGGRSVALQIDFYIIGR